MLDLAEAYEVANIRVFGSVARGTDGPQSDIDLLVDYDIDRGIQPLLHFMSDLELLLHEQVDVCPVDMLKDEILADALSYAVCF
jgi:predicted nucleotidyltransferase